MLRELARDLKPVRPIPRLRTVAAGVLTVWLLALVVTWIQGAALPRVGAGGPWSGAAFLGVLVGLAVTAAGATLAALAGAVPGREGEARVGLRLAALGLLLAAGGGVWAVSTAGDPAVGDPLWTGFSCLRHAALLGIPPALVTLLFLTRALARRSRLGAACALAGGVAMGAIVVHTSCTHEGALHMLLGHALAPFAVALLLAFPLAALVRRWNPQT
jgi:hypothetical protein